MFYTISQHPVTLGKSMRSLTTVDLKAEVQRTVRTVHQLRLWTLPLSPTPLPSSFYSKQTSCYLQYRIFNSISQTPELSLHLLSSFDSLFIFGCVGYLCCCINFSPLVLSGGYSLFLVCGLFIMLLCLLKSRSLKVCGALVFAACGLIGVIPGPKAQAQ